jgi:hypothetical protein
MNGFDSRMIVVVALAIVSACSLHNSDYCAGYVGNNCQTPVPDAGGGSGHDGNTAGCTSSSECTSSSALACDTQTGQCVQCYGSDDSACTGTTPICDGSANTCRACSSQSDCPTSACELSGSAAGSCAASAEVAWVAGTGTGTACTMPEPCATVTAALATHLPYIRVIGAAPITDAAVISEDVTIYADPGVVLMASAGAQPLKIASGTVEVRDLTISGSPATMPAVYVDSGATVTLGQDTIVGNSGFGLQSEGTTTIDRCLFASNTGGAAELDGEFHVINTIFAMNGAPGSQTGGVRLNPEVGTSTFAYSTVADNDSTGGEQAVSGIGCATSITLDSTIVSGNSANANCQFTYSLFASDPPTGSGNLAGAPGFVADQGTGAMPSDAGFYRIGSASSAIGHADTVGAPTDDIDGHHRPSSSGFDVGASEYQP